MTRSIPKRTAYRKRTRITDSLVTQATPMASGYAWCDCRDCFEIVAKRGMCAECQAAGCDTGECKAQGAYGAESDV